jgi:hypothetical protein
MPSDPRLPCSCTEPLAKKHDTSGSGASAMPFSVYPCMPYRIIPAFLAPPAARPALRAAAISATALPSRAVLGSPRCSLPSVALAVVTVLVGEDKLAPLLLDTPVARVNAVLSKGGPFARDSANVRMLVAALTGCPPSLSSRCAR